MAFHGSRGAPTGRSTSGRGFSGRSRGGNWGIPTSRGRGRGGFRGGRGKTVFDSARLAEQKQSDHIASNEEFSNASESEGELRSETFSSGEDDEEEDFPIAKPYTSLMQSLVDDAPPPTKKQKLHDTHHAIPQSLRNNESAAYINDVIEVKKPEELKEILVEAVAESLEEELEDEDDSSDPFDAHFGDPDENVLSQRLKALKEYQWAMTKTFIPNIGKVLFSIPGESRLLENWVSPAISGPSGLKLKQRLAKSMEKQRTVFEPLEQYIAPAIFNYHDVLFCERTPKSSENLRRLACLHVVNHVFKTRDRVIKNNSRLAKEDNHDNLDLRDQGFTRPKVLMLLPTRDSCVRMVNTIMSLCEPEQQENRKRFDDSYVDKGEKFSSDQAEDFRELFGANDDDMFRIGLKFTRRSIKYFSQFYNSDIIFASPLGLRMAIGSDEDKKVDHDFLSSIEIVIVDQADALLMQNWEHVDFIFEHLNLQPKEAHGCDFSRVRNWYLDNNAKYFRQTIALCAFNTPELNTLFFNHSKNWAGRIRITANYPGALQELGLRVNQTFSRLDSPNFATDPDIRFTYFTTAIIPSLTRHSKGVAGTLIFVPSYLDFVRVRNYFLTSATTSSLSFGIISEYTSVTEVARARSHFLTGRHKVLLYTERAHHFRRYMLRGVRKVIMYGLPDNPIFYKEIVGGYLGRSIQERKLEPGQGNVRVLFSKWDIMKLERVTGTQRVGKMINEKGDTFEFV